MKAIAAYAYGGVDQLHLVDLPTPQPGPDDVLVRVRAAGVNLIDAMHRNGYQPQHRFPLIPGWDVAGVVEAVGQNVTDVTAGDDVYGYNVGAIEGTYAEYSVVPAQFLAPKPASLSYIDAAAIPCVGLTAYQTLVDRLNVRAGETVAITAAAGGVGSVAVQVAVHLGARVIGTASGARLDYVRGLGAAHVVDYTQGEWVQAVRAVYPAGVDVALTAIAGETKQQTPGVVRDGGRMAWISGEELPGPPMERLIQGVYSFGFPRRDTFAALTHLIDTGRLNLPIAAVYPLQDAAKAQERIAGGNSGGKLVIEVP